MNQANPWTILSEKITYDNPWIRVTEYDVLNPKGGPGLYGKVHFKNLAIGILPLDDQLNTHLVGQYRFPLNQYSWEIPEGGGAMEQEAIDSAKRELLEETGLIANDWTEILHLHISNSVTDEDARIFLARGLEQREPMPEDTEELVIRKMPFQEAYEMTVSGAITDSISVAAIQKVQLMILEGRLK